MSTTIESGSLQASAAADASNAGIRVPDANLLFTGDFSRSGHDLVLTGADGAKIVLNSYFITDSPPSLISPEGAMLTGNVVTALAGPMFPGQYAQAGGGSNAKQAIGKVESSSGSASVVRTDGTTETLKAGDPVFQGDVVQTGPGSKLGISFIDGTIFSISANARMVLNSLVYDPDGSDNSMLFSLVDGTFTFSTGQIAPTGDMKIQTPVATMGIRGTTPTVEIVSGVTHGGVNFSIISDIDGAVGSYTLYSLVTGQPIGTVSNIGTIWQLISATGQIVEFDKTEEDLLNDTEAKIEINSIFKQWEDSTQQVPQAGPEGGNPPGSSGLNTNPQNPGTTGGEGNNGATGGEGQNDGQNNNQNENQPPPPAPTNINNVPPPPPTEAAGPNIINGDDNANVLNGTPGDDIINAFGGNDLIIAGAGDDQVFAGAGDDTIIAGEGEGDDAYDGGEGNDTIRYTSTSEGVTINLVTGVVTGVEINTDTIVNISNFVAGAGDDRLIISEDIAIFFDGRGGIDTIEFFGGLNIDTATTQIEAENIEIIDLNKTDANILTISAEDVQNDDGESVLQIRGGTTDTLNLTSEFYFDDGEGGGIFVEGAWDMTGDTAEHDGLTFDVYEFVGGEGGILTSVEVEQGINVVLGQTIIGNALGNDGPVNVGYYDASDGQGDASQIGPIQAAGHNAINIITPNAAALQGLNVLFLQVQSNSSYGTEFLNNLAAIHEAVAAGMTLIIHDRFVSNAESILPGSDGFNIVRDFGDSRNIDVLDPDSTVTDGPGGIVNNATLDGGSHSTHGFAVEGTLPQGAELILSTGDETHIVTFSYEFGEGSVIYSTIPLDFYLNGSGPALVSSNFRDIYAPNVVEYGAELSLDADLTLTGGPGNDILIGGPGDNTITGGPGADKFVIASLSDGIDTITDFGSQDTLDLTGLLNGVFDPASDNIDDFIQARTSLAGDTTISVDLDGPGALAPVDIAILQGVGAGVGVAVSIGDEDTSVTSAAITV